MKKPTEAYPPITDADVERALSVAAPIVRNQPKRSKNEPDSEPYKACPHRLKAAVQSVSDINPF